MSHFYLTLPSNSSGIYYPDNTLTHFVTKLHNDVSLSGEWEVGLSEIAYPRNWYNVSDQYMRISCNNYMKIIPQANPNENMPPSYDIHVGIPSGYYYSVSDLVEAINTSISKAFRSPVAAWRGGGVERYVDES
jgi:hypothetical protein